MRAAVCRTHGARLVIEQVDVAAPGPDEVRVIIEAAAICHSDVTYASGAWGGDTPAIYGHEAAGTVESVGRGVVGVAAGDRVIVGLLRTCGECFHCLHGEDHLCNGEFADSTYFRDAGGRPVVRGMNTGSFSEQTVVHQSQVVALPEGIPFASASLLACGVLTGFGAVANTAKVPAGATVAIIGVGGVGLGAVQGAVLSAASRVVAVDVVDNKLATAVQFGATHAINGSSADANEKVAAATGGIGPDFVFVTVGVQPAIDQALAMVRRGGSVVLVGMPPSGVVTSFETVELADASQRIIGSRMGSARMAVDVPALIELYQEGSLKLDEMVSNTYQLEQINEAIEEVVAGQVIRNVILFNES